MYSENEGKRAIRRINELEPRQTELNKYMEENNLSWQNKKDFEEDLLVKEAFEIWNEVRILGRIAFKF